ncbi:MAG: hypothetical protein ABEL51_00635 [Salinibacter sp.]
MPRTFTSPSAYHPSYSLLGRAVRAWIDDRLRGEALYIVVLTGLTLVLLMSHYLGWALLKPVLTEHPFWQRLFWIGQGTSVLVLLGLGLVGFRPAVRVRCGPETITLRQGDRVCRVDYTALTDVSTLSARRYHRHYRRYAATRIFLSAVPDEVICLHTEEGPVIVALSDPDAQTAVLDHLASVRSSFPEPAPLV